MARNPRVIVIGPEPVNRDEVQKMLALSGFSVLGEAGYGIEAVSLAKKSEPDVVVIAIEEPLIRALQTVEALADLLPQSPIIGHSSIKDSGSMRRAMVADVKDYLVSPVKEEELINSIHTVLAQEERRRARLAGETDEPIAAGTVVTVFGAKGGIGKTTIATNLATALVQKTKQSVVVVDLDTRFGDVAILMDIPQDKIKLVINSTNEASSVQPHEIRRMLGRDVFWSVPYDRNISAATQLGMPVVVAKPQSKASESLTELAYALSGVRRQQQTSKPKEVQKGGLLSRILGTVPEDKTEVSVE